MSFRDELFVVVRCCTSCCVFSILRGIGLFLLLLLLNGCCLCQGLGTRFFLSDLALELAEHVLRLVGGVSRLHGRSSSSKATTSIVLHFIKAVIECLKVVLADYVLGCIVIITPLIDEVIVGQRLLVGLLKLFSDVLAIGKVVLVSLPRIVQIRVEVKELAPGQVKVVDVLVHLLTHVNEVFTRHRIIDHGDPTSLFIALSCEEG